MQKELTDAGIHFSIIGVNQADKESGNDLITAETDLPWLQDNVETNVWELWGVQYRDIILVDTEHYVVSVYNVSLNDLTKDQTYDELYQIITELAE